ncbi:MAG TPA: hypothetical protein VFM88_02280 [Vicinamibacteria bacterium]|nr:hypothetical protein [Vicinamibacteria bacterium]
MRPGQAARALQAVSRAHGAKGVVRLAEENLSEPEADEATPAAAGPPPRSGTSDQGACGAAHRLREAERPTTTP